MRAVMQLVKITNPNPHALELWRGDVLQEVLRARDSVGVVFSTDLRASYAGKGALVVCQLAGDDLSEREWIQKVGRDRVAIHPDFAIKPKVREATA